MKTIVHLIIAGLVTFIVLKSTTFGWRFFSRSTINLKPQDKLLVERLKKHVYKLSSEIGDRNMASNYDNLERAAGYISGQFKAYGYQVQFQEYTLENKQAKNIIAVKKGIKLPEEVVIVAAHYDSCFNPGADDNASGIAGVLELARFWADKENNRSLEFVAFVNEEPPYFKTELMGSRVYAREAKASNKVIKAVVVLEMLGYYTNKINSQRYPVIIGIFYPNKGNFITVAGNLKSYPLVNKITYWFRKYSDFPIASISLGFIPGVDFSDHWSFWQDGYPAVMITDTAFFRTNNYHRNSDTWEKLNYPDFACVIEGFYAVIRELTR